MLITNWLSMLLKTPRLGRPRRRRRYSDLRRQKPHSVSLVAIESLEDRVLLASDFGDAPDTGAGKGAGNYQTTLADGGPSHVIDTSQATLFLGNSVDGDYRSQT